jgi:hypothetical protein
MSLASATAARTAQDASDVEGFRLRRVVEAYAAEDELEVENANSPGSPAPHLG